MNKPSKKTEWGKSFVKEWREYRNSKEGREANVPTGLPVFNATNFAYWLLKKYER